MHQFHRLPLDGQLYRLVWAGKIGQPRQERDTPRIHLWFAKIDDTSTFGLRYAASPSGLPQVLWLDESAGSIGMFPIGSFWRDGVRQDDAMYALPRDQKFRHVILPAQSWTLVSSNDYMDQGPSKYVSRSDYPLSGENHKGDREYFYDGLLIRCVASDGQLLLIPCYEVFRRFFAVSSEISNALLSGHWATEVRKLIHTDRSGVASDGKSYTVWPKGEMSRVACLALARFDLVDSARAAAASIYVELENARNRERRSGHWIVALPPWADESLRISFIGHKLSSGAVLVLRIFSASFPAVPLPVTMVREHLVMPSFIPPEEEPTRITNSVKRGHDEDEHTHIGGPEDPRNSHRVTQLPLDEPWEGVPFVKRTYARQPILYEVKFRDELEAKKQELAFGFAAAKSLCKQRRWRFRVVSETYIRTPFLENAKFLRGFRNYPDTGVHSAMLLEVLEQLQVATPAELLAATFQDMQRRMEAVGVLWRLVGNRSIGSNLMSKLTMSSEIWHEEPVLYATNT